MSEPFAVFRKNATEEVRVSLEDFKGHRLVNIRVWFTGDDGEMRPGKQGLALRVEMLPAMLDALGKVASHV